MGNFRVSHREISEYLGLSDSNPMVHSNRVTDRLKAHPLYARVDKSKERNHRGTYKVGRIKD